MARKTPGARGSRTSVKGPLIFSAVLAVIAGTAVLIFSTGGSEAMPRWDLAFIAAGIVFIVALVIAAMLSMTEKPNDEHLGKGSGINLRSSKIPGGAQNANLPRAGVAEDPTRYGSRRDEPAPETGSAAEGNLRRDDAASPGVDREDETPGPLHPPKE